jgi:hypothetical protein
VVKALRSVFTLGPEISQTGPHIRFGWMMVFVLFNSVTVSCFFRTCFLLRPVWLFTHQLPVRPISVADSPVLRSVCPFTHQLPVCPLSLADTLVFRSVCLFTHQLPACSLIHPLCVLSVSSSHQLPVCPISLDNSPVLRCLTASLTFSAISDDRIASNVH